MEMTWWLRNKIRAGETVSPWQHSFEQIRKFVVNYWKAAMNKKMKRTKINKPCRWSPPPLGWTKINFDSASLKGVAQLAVIIRNSIGEITKAWASEVCSDGSFATEASNVKNGFQVR